MADTDDHRHQQRLNCPFSTGDQSAVVVEDAGPEVIEAPVDRLHGAQSYGSQREQLLVEIRGTLAQRRE